MTSGAADLERALTAADPAALLVPPRILRRVIKKHGGLTGVGLQVPHRKSYVIRRESLLQIADSDDLGVEHGRALPDTLLLFPAPDPGKFRALPPGAALLEYWRLLFHARVHLAVRRIHGDGPDAEAVLHERVRRLGQAEIDEIRSVLRQENFLPPLNNVRSSYEEFVAVFLELRCFAPHRLPYYFPAIGDPEAVFRALDLDLDATALLAATRLAGAPDPSPRSPRTEDGAGWTEASESAPSSRPDGAAYARLTRRAENAEKRGNLVRAVLLRQKAVRVAATEEAARADVAALVERMTARLQAALGFPENEAVVWRRILARLVGPAATGFWTREARLLYDLQRACIDQERDVYAVDIVEWLVSWGRKPIVRLLPHQRQVNLVRRLRHAADRLASVRLPEADRKPSLDLLHAAISRQEERLRDRFRPLLAASLDESGLHPASYAERVVRDKLIEEMLDRVVDRGFLTIGDLRDAVARNRLKLPDLSGPAEFFLGDPLIRANRKLAITLDGVYRRGEIYLRWLQRLSSVAFGTLIGRFITLYLILPFGCAFLALEGVQHIVHPIILSMGHEGPIHLVNAVSLPLLGVFLLAVFHLVWFRRRVVGALRLLWRVVRGVFYDLPAAVMNQPLARAFFQSRLYLLTYQYGVKPFVGAALSALALYLLGADLAISLMAGAVLFLSLEVLLHSRAGMRLEEAWGDVLLRTWQLFSNDLIPGLFRLILAFFRRLLDDVERLLYTVDEWLRFRSGDSRGSLAVKAVLGLLWFFVTYVIRFCVNLLAEPQLNPIKHFPVVTVSHKLVLTFVMPALTVILLSTGMNPFLAGLAAFVVQFSLPGIPGFLVWEFKENWRLYRANQSPILQPQTAGSHGETISRLLRPGFHSGTLPKLYARLRRVKDAGTGKRHEELHHVTEAMRRFVVRNLLTVLAGSKTWGTTPPLHVGAIRLASNRIRIELCRLGQGEQSVHIDLEEHAGRLVAGFTAPVVPAEANGERRPSNGWLDRLPLEQVRAFTDALAGFYKACGVDVVREQVESALRPGMRFMVGERGLIVETGPRFEAAARYDLDAEGLLVPQPLEGRPPARLRAFSADKLVFKKTEIRWEDWVQTWERDLAGKEHRPLLMGKVQLLPLGTAKGRLAARRRK
jgi:hypothetical protein